MDFSLDAQGPSAAFNLQALEVRATSGQDGFSIEPAVHPGGTVYLAFFGWRSGPRA